MNQVERNGKSSSKERTKYLGRSSEGATWASWRQKKINKRVKKERKDISLLSPFKVKSQYSGCFARLFTFWMDGFSESVRWMGAGLSKSSLNRQNFVQSQITLTIDSEIIRIFFQYFDTFSFWLREHCRHLLSRVSSFLFLCVPLWHAQHVRRRQRWISCRETVVDFD